MASDLPSTLQIQHRPPAITEADRLRLLPISLGLLCLILIALPFLPAIGLEPGATAPSRLALLLSGAGLASLGFIGWSLLRYRHLAGRFVRRAAQEAEFIELTCRLMVVGDRSEAAEQIAHGSMAVTPVAGAYVESLVADGTEAEVLAAAGQGVPLPGSRIPLHESATARCGKSHHPIHLPGDLCTVATNPAPAWLLAAPLLTENEPTGALVLISSLAPSPEPPHLALDRIQIVADFAALALRRIALAEEARQRSRELERLLESKARFIRGLTHDLRNPLSAIDGYAQIIESEVKGRLTPEHRRYVARIRTATGSMIRILDDLVQLARVEAGELHLEPGPTDPSSLVASIIDQYRPGAGDSGIELIFATPHPLPEVMIDPERVRQVVGNLISNAIKYTPAPGTIRVRTEITFSGDGARPGSAVSRSGRWLVITVSDSGPGIAVSEQERIFEEFTRLAPRSGEGTGLGLAISRQIARAMGGEITVESRPGHGAAFTLWVPAP